MKQRKEGDILFDVEAGKVLIGGVDYLEEKGIQASSELVRELYHFYVFGREAAMRSVKSMLSAGD